MPDDILVCFILFIYFFRRNLFTINYNSFQTGQKWPSFQGPYQYAKGLYI